MSALPLRTVLRVAWRSLFIQAGYSPDAMQTLGLLYALAPAWRHLYDTDEARNAAVRRHLSTFNTHPYTAAALVGGILHYELKLARGEATVEDIARFKSTLMGPLAALGDGFFWLSLRPATGAVGVALVPVLGVWAPVVFLFLYNVVHFVARAWLFAVGLRSGAALVTRVKSLRVPTWSDRLRSITALTAAGTGAWLTVRFGAALHGAASEALDAATDVPEPTSARAVLGAAMACLVLGALGVALVERKVQPLAVLYGAAALAVVLGVLW